MNNSKKYKNFKRKNCKIQQRINKNQMIQQIKSQTLVKRIKF